MAKLISLSSSNPICIFSREISTKLFVGGLSFYTTEKGLFQAFSKHGQVVEAKLVSNKVTARSRGYGFVTYASEDEAEKATRQMNGMLLNGRVICVEYYKPFTDFDSDGPY